MPSEIALALVQDEDDSLTPARLTDQRSYAAFSATTPQQNVGEG